MSEMLHGSDGEVFHFDPKAQEKAPRRERHKRYLQRQLARQVKGYNRSRKTLNRIARISEQQANVRLDFAHQVSHELARKTDFKVFVFEDLKIQNMTRSPKPKQDEESGQYLPNGASAKAGLNHSILGSCWGNVVSFTHAPERVAQSGKGLQIFSTCIDSEKKDYYYKTHGADLDSTSVLRP